MRTYDDASTLVGTSEHASSAGGWRRFITFERRGDAVAARMFRTDVVTWHHDGRIVLDTGGYSTPSTFDGMATALGIGRAAIGTRSGIPRYQTRPFTPNPSGYGLTTPYTFTIDPGEDVAR